MRRPMTDPADPTTESPALAAQAAAVGRDVVPGLAAGLALAGVALGTGSVLAVTGAALVVAAGLGAWELRRDRPRARLEARLREAVERLRAGEPFQPLESADLGRHAALAEPLNSAFETLGGTAQRVLSVVSEVHDLPTRMGGALQSVRDAADNQEAAVEETASLMADIDTSIRSVSERTATLSSSSDETASAVLEMGSAVEEVARNVGALHESVESSSSSIHEMGASIRQVADSAEHVGRIAEETAAAMTQMDRTVQEVGRHVGEATTLTEKVSTGAELGARAVDETIADIEAIRERTQAAKAGLGQLVERLREVVSLMGVIGEINDETNLLSLNAAIIAAQAGEQGKAFLVVANHVKLLAQRTSESTRDIDRLLTAVAKESDDAVVAMDAGIQAIEQGVRRSRHAGEALGEIRASAAQATHRAAEIARASEEQRRASSGVARSAHETSAQVRQITEAMTEQRKASEQMLQHSEAALERCRHVHRSTEEQRDTGRYITESVSGITDMIREIHEHIERHARSSASVSEAVKRLLENAQSGGDRIPEIQEMLVALAGSAEAVVEEMTRFESAAHRFRS